MPIRTKIQIDNDQSFKGLQAKFRQRPPGGKCFKTLASFVTDEVAKCARVFVPGMPGLIFLSNGTPAF